MAAEFDSATPLVTVCVIAYNHERYIAQCLESALRQKTTFPFEVLVRDLSLDCTDAERRTSRAAVSIDVLRAGRGARAVILSGDGNGTADAKGGDYSAAFSQAFDAALESALRDLKAQPPPQPLETTPKGEQK